MNEILDKILPYEARAEFCQIFRSFFGQWSFKKKCFWDLLTFKDAEDAEYACKQIGIPFQTVDFVKEYWNEVFEKLVEEYQQGWTPNPDVDCNRSIKFGHFFQHCREQIGNLFLLSFIFLGLILLQSAFFPKFLG